MTTEELQLLSATEVVAKLRELARSQPRYAGVDKVIEKAEQRRAKKAAEPEERDRSHTAVEE